MTFTGEADRMLKAGPYRLGTVNHINTPFCRRAQAALLVDNSPVLS